MAIRHHRVVIVGTGFSGLGMAVRLAQRGDHDYVVLEADEVGGTWRDNRYPGCACDVPSRLYSFSFAQLPSWSRDFATAPEIWAYLRDVADRYAVRDRIEFGADLQEAAFDEATRRWTLTAADGRQWTCDALVMGVGALHEPTLPEIEGLDTFEGEVMHTARWPEQDHLDGRRVAVVGTGASAIQVIPEVAPRAAHTTVFQRTPLSSDYWPTFARSDVSLVTDLITQVEPHAVVTADGARHEVDVLVLGTGFDVSGSTDRIDIRGLGGRTLRQAWSGGMHTNLGITVAGFPELYLLLGPNTGLGHNSVVTMIEFATGYVLQAIDRGRGGAWSRRSRRRTHSPARCCPGRRTRSGRQAAAAGTSTGSATTPACGPARPSATGGAPARSTRPTSRPSMPCPPRRHVAHHQRSPLVHLPCERHAFEPRVSIVRPST